MVWRYESTPRQEKLFVNLTENKMTNEKMKNIDWDKFNKQLLEKLDERTKKGIRIITPEDLTQSWIKLIFMYPQYIEQLLTIWDRLVSGEDYNIVKDWAKENVFDYQGFYLAVSFYGRKIKNTPGNYLQSDAIRNMIIKQREEDRINNKNMKNRQRDNMFGHGGSRERWS